MDKKLVENFATWHVFFCSKLGPQLIFQLHTAQVSVHLVFLYNLQTTKGAILQIGLFFYGAMHTIIIKQVAKSKSQKNTNCLCLPAWTRSHFLKCITEQLSLPSQSHSQLKFFSNSSVISQTYLYMSSAFKDLGQLSCCSCFVLPQFSAIYHVSNPSKAPSQVFWRE